MSVDSLFKQKNAAGDSHAHDDVSGEYRSRAETEGYYAQQNSPNKNTAEDKGGLRKRGKNNQRNTSSDDETVTPEVKQARTRFIGAVALAIVMVIGLPWLLDKNPHPNLAQVKVQLQDGDGLSHNVVGTTNLSHVNSNSSSAVSTSAVTSSLATSPTTPISTPTTLTPPRPNPNSSKPEKKEVQPELRRGEGVATVTQQGLSDDEVIVPSSTQTHTNSSNKESSQNPSKVENKTADAKKIADKKAEEAKKLEAKKAEEKKLEDKKIADAKKAEEAQRVKKLLEGGEQDKAHEKSVEKKPSFSLQVAAISSTSRINELQAQLKAAQVKSYTQKIDTKNGEITRLRVGPFSNKDEAEKVRQKLVKLGLTPNWVNH